MRKLTTVTIGLLLTFVWAQAQISKVESARIRERLNLPVTIVITPAKDAKLPTGPTLKVYIATGKDSLAYRDYVNSIEKWNKEDGLKYGHIQVVPELSRSDVILTFYRAREGVPTSPRPIIGPGGIPGTDLPRGPILSPSDERLRANTLYSYLLTRQGEALEIIYRDVVGLDRPDAERRVLDELKKRMKRR